MSAEWRFFADQLSDCSNSSLLDAATSLVVSVLTQLVGTVPPVRLHVTHVMQLRR
jgi:hypothetical protein